MPVFLNMPAALHDITQPVVAYENRHLDLVDPTHFQQKRFLFSAFLHGEVFLALKQHLFFDSLMLGGFSSGRFFSEKNSFPLVIFLVFPCSFDLFDHNTRTQCSFDQAHFTEIGHDGSILFFLHQTKD